jgi:hypothetical protein
VHASFLRKRGAISGFYQVARRLRGFAGNIFAAFHIDQLALNASRTGEGGAGGITSRICPLKPGFFVCSMQTGSQLRLNPSEE